jgi:hypothetical protein
MFQWYFPLRKRLGEKAIIGNDLKEKTGYHSFTAALE